MMRKQQIACWVVLVWLSWPAWAYTQAPAWMREAAAKAPAYGEKVAAVVLLDEQRVKVDDDGSVTTVTRRVVRILTREGRGFAYASEMYLPETGKVRELRAGSSGPRARSSSTTRTAYRRSLSVALASTTRCAAS